MKENYVRNVIDPRAVKIVLQCYFFRAASNVLVT